MAEIICAGNAIKEVLSARECLAAMQEGARGAGANVAGSFLISDGGDGFLDVCETLGETERHEIQCTGPLGDDITAPILFDPIARTAYIETALCSGLNLVDPARRNVMISGTGGLGHLVAAARDLGALKTIVGLGGSATCDGGIGLLWRLGDMSGRVREDQNEPRVAMDMPEMPSPDVNAIREWLGEMQLIACVDVHNPLLGLNGAARVFAPQKGASAEETEQLEAWMSEWCERVQRNSDLKICGSPGSGAAGGLGFAFLAIGAELVPGGRTVCELTGLTAALHDGCLLVTAEGRFDMTSIGGKAPWEAAQQAVEKGGGAAIFCGVSDADAAKEAADHGISICEFGRDIPVEQRRNLTPGKLADALLEFLNTEMKTSA